MSKGFDVNWNRVGKCGLIGFFLVLFGFWISNDFDLAVLVCFPILIPAMAGGFLGALIGLVLSKKSES